MSDSITTSDSGLDLLASLKRQEGLVEAAVIAMELANGATDPVEALFGKRICDAIMLRQRGIAKEDRT